MTWRARLTGHRRRLADTWCCEPARLDWLKYRHWNTDHTPRHRRPR